MNLYVCMISLKQDAKALPFSAALEAWMSHLQAKGAIGAWSLSRRKLNLAADCYRDFLLQIEVEGLTQLDKAFGVVSHPDDDVEHLHMRVHDMIDTMEFALYRPFPDQERAERVALL